MQTSNDDQKIKQDRSTWDLIAEYFLSEGSDIEGVAAEFTVGKLFNSLRELDLPLEFIEKILGTMIEIAFGKRGQLNPNDPHLPARIGLFCQKKMIEDVFHSGNQNKRGWGYYVIEKGRDFPSTSCREFDRSIELYLYKEGV